MGIRQVLCMGTLGLVLVACRSTGAEEQAVPSDVRIYLAEDIANRQVHFIWMELPASLQVGANEARVFMARTDPPGMLIPTETELPSSLNPRINTWICGP